MKARARIITLIISVSVFAVAWTNAAANELTELTFGQYYKPYEPNIEPNAPGYVLPLDLKSITNYQQVSSKLDLSKVSPLIQQNGFDVLGSFRDDLYEFYIYMSQAGIPVFVTTDTLLHIFHVQFDWSIMSIERHQLISSIQDMTIALKDCSVQQYNQLDGDLKEAARRNVAYLSVAQKLLDPNCEVPETVSDIVSRELSMINAHQGLSPSNIFTYNEDYSQYVPRGHYTRSPRLQRYFKTMIWYGRMTFLLTSGPGTFISKQEAKIQTLQAFLLAISLEKTQVGECTALEVLERAYKITSFFVGLSDDLTPFDYLSVLNKVLGKDFAPSDLTYPVNFESLKNELKQLPSPMIHGGIGGLVAESLENILENTKGMRLMGQRRVPDSRVFQHLIYPEVGCYLGDPNAQPFTCSRTSRMRGYPRCLDLMALLGSDEAQQILVEDGDCDYANYQRRFEELKDEFDKMFPADWNRNLYWSWLYTLIPLLNKLPEGYPNFMRTSAWRKRNLNTALASWTELKHDTILYSKSATWYAGMISEGKKSPLSGYVEPSPRFYARLLGLTQMTLRGLKELDVLSQGTEQRLKSLEDVLNRLIVISNKELRNQRLSEDECRFIKNFESSIKRMTSGITGLHLKTTIVADVFTNLQERHVIEEGVGKIDMIVVACTAPDGSVFLAIGPALSYYEFKHPMSDRLTDESWKRLLGSPKRPERPKWYMPLMGTIPADSE